MNDRFCSATLKSDILRILLHHIGGLLRGSEVYPAMGRSARLIYNIAARMVPDRGLDLRNLGILDGTRKKSYILCAPRPKLREPRELFDVY